LRPANLLSAYAALPLLVAPAELWSRLRLRSADPGHGAARESIGRRAGRFDAATGFPRRLDAAKRRGRRLAATAAAAILLLLALGGTVVFAGMRPVVEVLAPTPSHTGVHPTGGADRATRTEPGGAQSGAEPVGEPWAKPATAPAAVEFA
jgi:hypothetical protein